MGRKVYYAHSTAIYDTEQEKRDLAILYALGLEVVNPNSEHHQKLYEALQMDYFEQVVKGCNIVAFRGNPDGSIPCGVAQEIEWARDTYIDVLELPCGISRRTLDYEQTLEFLEEQGQR